MHFSFRIAAPGLERTAFLLERDRLSASGDLETAFLADAGPVTRHRSAQTGHLVAALAAEPGVETLAVIRNPKLVLDAGLPGRIAAALERIGQIAGPWSIAAAGGLTASSARVCALYANKSPFLPTDIRPKPLIDPLPDLWLADAAWIRLLAMGGRVLPETGLEILLCLQGYLEDRLAVFAPELIAGIDGALRARDAVKLQRDLRVWFGPALPDIAVETLMGPVQIDGQHDGTASIAGPERDLDKAISAVAQRHCTPLSLSIVTRTRFDRPHLLDRLLTSISRARPEHGAIEIVLSSDADLETCDAAFERLSTRFVNLRLRLQHNPADGHSRVTNLIAGLHAANGTHVAVMDDDDYVDLFAFDEMRQALFLGAEPLIVTSAQVHEEEWVETPGGRHILANSTPRTHYPASSWRDMFGGINCLPVCALLMPRERLIERLAAFEFRHDLSEDYALALLVLTDPGLPEIVEMAGLFGHISLRPHDGHSIALADRRTWSRDIALYLTDLARNPQVAGPGTWALLTREQSAAQAVGHQTISDLRNALARAERQTRLLTAENARLRGDYSDGCPAASPGEPGTSAPESTTTEAAA
ncbi:MAG: glycosyltransferase family 2 protein [Paracoccaceae bacterium]|nr:glycosyltransferase family 2 protein [Paracoccaceae bacterium]